MPVTIDLPDEQGRQSTYTLSEPVNYQLPEQSFSQRVLYAAVHVVADATADNGEGKPAAINWDATLAFRHHLWRYGFGVAEAMDTAQRGFGLDWAATQELISRSVAEAAKVDGLIACGAGTDQLGDDTPALTLDDVVSAYEEQIDYIEACGGKIILMASRALAAVAKDASDYIKVYSHLLTKIQAPVILHWLGDMFDPKLKGYWGSDNWQDAGHTLLDIINQNANKVDGMKMSLLDADKEIYLRRRLPADVKMYTGDDFNYDVLIKGDDQGFSHGLLGIFDPIAPAAAAAMHALEAGDLESYDRIFAPTVPLSRHIFETPTFYYKTGVVFMAYLNGRQDHFKMVGGLEDKRSTEHLVKLFKLADQAGLLRDPELAVARMQNVLEQRMAKA
jgi:dihydrodipicolinate synthase/N-acetylneuraminate lyase